MTDDPDDFRVIAEPTRPYIVNTLRINDMNVHYDIVAAQFIIHETLPPYKTVELNCGFDAHGEPRIIQGVPTLLRYRTNLTHVLRYYELEQWIPKLDPLERERFKKDPSALHPTVTWTKTRRR